MTIEILNTHVHGDVGEFCGRGSPLGNPHPITQTDNRDVVCDKFVDTFNGWVRDQVPYRMNELHRLRDIYERTGSLRLRCFCFPKRCHLFTIRDWILENAFQDESNY